MAVNPKVWVFAGIVVAIFIVREVFTYVAPFFIGILIATMIHPVVDYCEKKGFSRTFVSLSFVVFIFGSLVILLGFSVIGLWSEIDQLIDLFQTLPEHFAQVVPVIGSSLNQFIISLLFNILNVIKEMPQFLFAWFLAALTTFFISRDKVMIVKFITDYLPQAWHPQFFGLKHEILQGLFSYIKAQLILMWISACIAVSGFLLINQAYAWVLGILVGLLDLIPLLGPSLVFIAVIIYNLSIARFFSALVVAGLWLILLLIRQIYEPKIISSQLGLHPLSSMVAIYIGVKLMGASGFILGPLFLICCKAFYFVLF